MYSSEEENVEIVESIAHPERQILQEGNQVEVLPKWDLKPVYCNLIWVMDFTLKFSVHDDGDDDHGDNVDHDDHDDHGDHDDGDDYTRWQAPAAIHGVWHQ